MNKDYRIILLILVLYLTISINSIHTQQLYNCEKMVECFDPELPFSSGDQFNWEVDGYSELYDYYDRTLGFFPVKIMKNIQLQLLQIPNGETLNTVTHSSYFRFEITYEFEHNGTVIIERDRRFNRINNRLALISPTLIYITKPGFQNVFELWAEADENTRTFEQPNDNNPNALNSITKTTTRGVEDGIYTETELTVTTFQPTDRTIASELLSTETFVTRIDINTGLLLNFEYEFIDVANDMVDEHSIANKGWGTDGAVLELGIFANPVVWFTFFSLVAVLTYLYFRRSRR